MFNMLHLERLRLYNEERGAEFDQTWNSLLKYIKGEELQHLASL